MNDRFKFRVWNKARQCFMTEKKIFICGNGELVLIDEALNRTWVKDNPNYKVSFCTGLKDKNGKLIFEGDVVSIDDGELKGIAQKHDKFDEYYGCIEIKLICKHTTIYKPTVFAESEVIGNIYENKELLQECECWMNIRLI